jgi:hypothetical protein
VERVLAARSITGGSSSNCSCSNWRIAPGRAASAISLSCSGGAAAASQKWEQTRLRGRASAIPLCSRLSAGVEAALEVSIALALSSIPARAHMQ